MLLPASPQIPPLCKSQFSTQRQWRAFSHRARSKSNSIPQQIQDSGEETLETPQRSNCAQPDHLHPCAHPAHSDILHTLELVFRNQETQRESAFEEDQRRREAAFTEITVSIQLAEDDRKLQFQGLEAHLSQCFEKFLDRCKSTREVETLEFGATEKARERAFIESELRMKLVFDELLIFMREQSRAAEKSQAYCFFLAL